LWFRNFKQNEVKRSHVKDASAFLTIFGLVMTSDQTKYGQKAQASTEMLVLGLGTENQVFGLGFSGVLEFSRSRTALRTEVFQ